VPLRGSLSRRRGAGADGVSSKPVAKYRSADAPCGYRSADFDLRVADLHYRDLCEWAVGRNAAAGWDSGEEEHGRVTTGGNGRMPE
jgi:hypothetical protein